ncbi:hypothetical protein BC834DRAFT_46710 [Gloeopeniophorella convolvens]|nr:hypothetical protein BC834DRAFT_46710 [Gloeopeniophorella convolvens]
MSSYRQKGIKCRASAIMLAVSTCTQCISIVHWSLQVTIWCQSVITGGPLSESITQARDWLSVISVLLADAFVIWRATTLWNRSTWRIAVSDCIVTLDAALHLFAMSPAAPQLFGLLMLYPASIILSILCNLWACALVANKAWLYRDQVTDILRTSPGQKRAMVIASAFLESGIIPATIWIFLLVASSLPFVTSDETFVIATESISQLSVVYVSGIIIARCLRNSFCGEIKVLELESSLQDSTCCPLPPKNFAKGAAGGTS